MKKVNVISVVVLVLTLGMSSCQKEKEKSAPAVDALAIKYKLKTSWPHDVKAFTQGLVVHNGLLYESTGQKKSWLGIVDVSTGTPDKKVILDDRYFGEGITILNNKIYQLTWQTKKGFIYDLKTFKKLGEFDYATEGWGLTHDNKNLIMSDGSEKLTFLDTTSLKPVRSLTVIDEYGPVKKLNELEYIEGAIFANQWETNRIVKIDPQTGKVIGRMDLTPLVRDANMSHENSEVLNGIAYHSTTKSLLVTGKYWPKIYVLSLN
ncbi:MAG: glutaminyl-peptide cyclotransferase [Bacteroidota bacterium]